MEPLAIIIMILIVLALTGVIAYFAYVYLQDKDNLTSQINNANAQIASEQSNRLSNIKYVVDQVNSVHSDIAKQFSSSNAAIFKSLNDENIAISSNLNVQNIQYTGLNKSITGLQSNVSTNSANINAINSGFGNYITFGNPQGTNAYNLLNLPSSPPPNMNLMSQVNLLMGMTAQNLSPIGSSNINFCYGPDNKNCTSFPNSDGNTIISAPALNKAGTAPGAIILNGPTTVNNLKICNTSTPQTCATLSIDPSGNLTIDKPIVPNGNNSNVLK